VALAKRPGLEPGAKRTVGEGAADRGALVSDPLAAAASAAVLRALMSDPVATAAGAAIHRALAPLPRAAR